MYFLIENDELLVKYNASWDKVSVDIKKIDRELACNREFLKNKIKSHSDEIINFHDKRFLRWILIVFV